MPTYRLPLAAFLMLLAACVPLQPTDSNPAVDDLSFDASADHAEPMMEAGDSPSSSSAAMTSTGAVAVRMSERGIVEIGDERAPLTLTVFTNYSCAYCGEFFGEMEGRIRREFVENGTLRMRIVAMPLVKYPNSILEASALLCATALGKGHKMHDWLTTTTLRPRAAILAHAKILGLSTTEFTKCLDAQETKDLLAQQKEFAAAANITLVPTFILNDETRTGLPSYADLRGWIRSVQSEM